MKLIDIIIALLVAFFWGSSFVVVKLGAEEAPSFITLTLRFILTFCLIFPFCKKLKISFLDLLIRSMVFTCFIASVYLAVFFGASANLAVIIMQLAAPLTVILARFMLDEKFTLYSILGVLFSFVGVVVILFKQNLKSSFISILLLLAGALFNAIFNIQSRKYSNTPPLDCLCWYSLMGSVLLFALSLIFEGNPMVVLNSVSNVYWFSVFYSVSMAGVFGLTSWMYLLKKYPVYKVMPYNLLVPLFGVICSILVLRESVSLNFVIGGILIIIGVIFSQKKEKI